MSTKNEHGPVEVYAGSAVQAGILRSLLGNAEIEAYLKDEFTGVIAPWHSSPGGAAAVRVLVAAADQDRAAQVVREFEENIKEE